MITATLTDDGYGHWVKLECDCPAVWFRVLGPFLTPEKLADDMKEHLDEHLPGPAGSPAGGTDTPAGEPDDGVVAFPSAVVEAGRADGGRSRSRSGRRRGAHALRAEGSGD